jgi:hypothetical protein
MPTKNDIESDVRVLGASFTFSLPDWISDDKYCFSKAHHYDQYHAWAGSYSHTTEHNIAETALFELDEVKEVCLHPMSAWLVMDIDAEKGGNAEALLKRFRVKLMKVLETLKKYEKPQEEE